MFQMMQNHHFFFFFMFNQNDSATRFRCPNTITGIKQPSKIVNFCTALAWLWFPADLTWIICTYAPLSNRAATVCNGSMHTLELVNGMILLAVQTYYSNNKVVKWIFLIECLIDK